VGPFAALTGVEVLRSTAFFGLNTFIELYWIRDLHASRSLAGIALTCFLAGEWPGPCSAAGSRTGSARSAPSSSARR